MQPTINSTAAVGSNRRINTLDSLRGLAALSVVAAHLIGCAFVSFTIDVFTPFYLIRAAHEAVIFFFILSGYVLVYQYNTQKFDYGEFITRRVFRIYVPYITATALSIVLYLFFNGPAIHNSSTWINFNWHSRISARLMLGHFLLLGNFNTNAFNPVIWSLVHEMRMSVIFPLLLLSLRFNWRGLLLCCASLSALAGLCFIFDIEPSAGYKTSYTYTMHYFSMFTMGGLIARYQTQLTDWYMRNSKLYNSLLLLAALLVYSYAHLITYLPEHYHKYRLASFGEVIEDWVVAAAASYFMIAAIAITKGKSWLKGSLPLTLGKISYSLYLVHVPVILATYSLLHQYNIYAVLLLGFILSVATAFLFNKLVEKRAALLGKRASTWAKFNLHLERERAV